MINVISENRRGLKHEQENLPCGTATGCFSRSGGRYQAFIVCEYRDPFASFRNELPQAAVEMFKTLFEESDLSNFFGTESLGEELFFNLSVKTDLLLAEMAPHDTHTADNFSMACVLIDTVTMDTKISFRGKAVYGLITDKVTGEINHIWPKTRHASLSAFGFDLSPKNNIILSNEGLFINLYNIRENRFYTGFSKIVASRISDPFYFKGLQDIAYIAIDLDAEEYEQDTFPPR